MQLWRRSGVALLVLALWAGVARADDVSEARRHYSAGMAHYNLREYGDAVTEFQAAYRLVPDAVFLYNLGQAHRLMRHDRDALYFYQAYLRAQPDAPNRAEVSDRIAKLQDALAQHPDAAPATTPPSATPPAATPSPPPPATSAAIATSAPPRHTPAYKKWWVWTLVGVAAVGIGVGLGVGLGTSGNGNRTYPTVSF